MPRARGSASRINKRTSHVLLTLIEKTTEKREKKEKKAIKETNTEEKKVSKKSKKVVKPEVKE